MFYRAFRAVASLVLRLFFRVEPAVDPSRALELAGPVIFVGNHPNGLIDPGMVFMLARRHVTFLAKEPLFRMPVLGWLLKGMDALPVFRKQDGANTAANEATLTASISALVKGRAITIFPEGKSHSEPQLAELKTGCARIALEAVRQGADVRIVPIGFTYSEKNRFKSRVHVDVGAPVRVRDFLEKSPDGAPEAVRALTDSIADALRAVTLNLEQWEDLPILQTAEALYALAQGDHAGDVDRQRAFAKGMALLRAEQPERFEGLKQQLAAYRRRLDLVELRPRQVTTEYRAATVFAFVLRNVLWLAGLPVFLAGMALFTIPYWVPIAITAITKPEKDTESTVKVLTLMLLAPLWWALLTAIAWLELGAWAGVATLLATIPVALFTRWYFERRLAALRDARVFFLFWSRARFRARLVAEGELLAKEIDAVAGELRERVLGAPAAQA